MNELLHMLLSFFFTKDVFLYQKILKIHEQELIKITGSNLRDKDFLYMLPYTNYTKDVMWSFKFKNNQSVANLFGRLLYETLPDHLIRWEQFEGFTDPLLLIVPSSKQTLRIRGYNQNDLIVHSFLKQGGDAFVTHLPKALKKIKNIPKQSRTRSRQERLKNPKGTFAIANTHLPAIKNRNIILFDDVLTTGATTKEIKKLLLKAGASQIKIIVITH